MSIPQQGGGTVGSRDDLVKFLSDGCKPKSKWGIGTEHEKFGFDLETLSPLPYEGPSGIHAMLTGLKRFGWEPVLEEGNIIGLSQNGASVSLEPGGQLELSGANLKTLHQTCNEVHTHLDQVKEVADELGVGFLGLGVTPDWTREDIHVMPKGRYGIMSSYMPKKGTMGLDMMFRSCTIQTNLDFGSEPDMVQKLRVALALQPVATALFANSPFLEGKPSGYLSYRAHIWTDTDPDRTGVLPFVFEDGFGFEAYTDYALDVPMYFVYRDGIYHDVSGKSFRDFMDGKLEGFEGQMPTLSDWADHLTTIFPEARIKQYMEVRGADGGPWDRICALPALWVGLFYNQAALDGAWDLARDWSPDQMEVLRRDVARLGFKAEIQGRSVLDIAKDMVGLAKDGLKVRGELDSAGVDEVHFLATLHDSLERGKTPAEDLLDKFKTDWAGSVKPIYTENAY
jgi:glutamate--cysteine ligase